MQSKCTTDTIEDPAMVMTLQMIDSMASCNNRLRAILIIVLMDLQWWVLFCVYAHICMWICVRVLFSRSVQRIAKGSSCDAGGYLQPRLLQKLNCHTEGGRRLDRNRNNERLRKEQQLCGNRKGKVTAAAANWWGFGLISLKAVVATVSSHKKKKPGLEYLKGTMSLGGSAV